MKAYKATNGKSDPGDEEKQGISFRARRPLKDEFDRAVVETRDVAYGGQRLRKGSILEMFLAFYVTASPDERRELNQRLRIGMGRWVDRLVVREPSAEAPKDEMPRHPRFPKGPQDRKRKKNG